MNDFRFLRGYIDDICIGTGMLYQYHEERIVNCSPALLIVDGKTIESQLAYVSFNYLLHENREPRIHAMIVNGVYYSHEELNINFMRDLNRDEEYYMELFYTD